MFHTYKYDYKNFEENEINFLHNITSTAKLRGKNEMEGSNLRQVILPEIDTLIA